MSAELDRNQHAAVSAGPVDVFISAGAGSGKTRVLAARFVSAVLGTPPYLPVDPRSLLTVTYTDKAAAELTERIRVQLGAAHRHAAARAVGDAWISTIHGMCGRILRQYAFDAAIDPRFVLLDQAEASALEADCFDRTVRAVLPEDPSIAELLKRFGYEDVFSAVTTVGAGVRALGLHVGSLEPVPDEMVQQCLRDAASRCQRIAEAVAGLRACAATAKAAAVVAAAACALGGAVAEDDPEECVLALEGFSLAGLRTSTAVEGLGDLVAEAREVSREVALCRSQLCARPLEAAFVRLLCAHDGSYGEAKRERGALDFEDLQLLTERLLADRPDVAEELGSRFAMLMVDEFQDTNALQLRILERLAHGNLCTVGDENQSIYSFRHADVEVFRARSASAPVRVSLTVNYRIQPQLLEALNALFGHGALFGSAFVALDPPPTVGPPTFAPDDEPLGITWLDLTGVTGAERRRAEAECVADRVCERLAAGAQLDDVAVLLARMAGGRASALEQALTRRGVPTVLSSAGGLLSSSECAEAKALLGVIDNVGDDRALITLLAGRLTGLSADALLALRLHADTIGQTPDSGGQATLWAAATDPRLSLPREETSALRRTVRAIEQARARRGSVSLGALLTSALLDLEADLAYFRSGGGTRAWGNVLKLARLAQEHEGATGDGIKGFLSYLRSREEHGAAEPEATLDDEFGAVRIMSIHAAKGLEFDDVIVAGMGAPPPPDSIVMARLEGVPTLGIRLKSDAGTQDTLGRALVVREVMRASAEEAKRVLYVACTRARRTLGIVAITDPVAPADDSPAGLLRQALGLSQPGLPREGTVPLGAASARITTAEPTPAVEAPVGAPVVFGPPALPGPQDGAASAAPDPHSSVPPVKHVSYSALDGYRACPYRFYLTRVLGLPPAPAPEGSARLAFGTAAHAVLERCTGPRSAVNALASEVAVAHALGIEHIDRLVRAVSWFLGSAVAIEAFASPRVVKEAPIAVNVAGATLSGSIDLLASGSSAALIVDYKTGADPLGEQEARERYELQGQCYALAVLTAGTPVARVVFAEIERERLVEYRYTADEIPVLAEAISAVIRPMREGRFAPLEAYQHGLCDTCPGFGGMCPVTRPSRGDVV